MLALAHHYDELLTTAAGAYRARVYGEVQDDGMWGGWLVFFPMDGSRVIATDRETTQSSLADLSYWASGLTHLYLHGALERALALQPEAQLARELERLEALERSASARAETLETAASIARAESKVAETAREQTADHLLQSVADAAELEAVAHERAAAAARREAQAADRIRRSSKPRGSPRTRSKKR